MASLTKTETNYSFRNLQEKDTQQAHQLTKKLGWSATQQEWANNIAFAAKTSFVVIYENNLIGVGLGLAFANQARLARIIIDQAHQKKGLGTALIGRLITALKSNGCTCIELDATKEGHPLYEKFGFKTQYQIVTLIKVAGKVDSIIQDPCQHCQKADLDQIEALDQKAFGSSRRFYIERAFEQNHIFVSRQQGKITGFILCILGENGIRIGAWRSENEPDAERLIKTVVCQFAQYKQTIHIPQKHASALALVDQLGFKTDYISDTMRLGDTSPSANEATGYAVWSLALG